MTWQDVHDLVKGWRRHPPLQRMFQDFLKLRGIEYKDEDEQFEKPVPTGGGAWFEGMDQDQFTSKLSEQAAALANKLKLH